MQLLRTALRSRLLVAPFALFAPSLAAQTMQAVPQAQAPSIEPPVEPGMVGVRIYNDSDCPVLLKASINGTLVSVKRIHARSAVWLHAHPEGNAAELDVLVSPRLCQLPAPTGNGVRADGTSVSRRFSAARIAVTTAVRRDDTP